MVVNDLHGGRRSCSHWNRRRPASSRESQGRPGRRGGAWLVSELAVQLIVRGGRVEQLEREAALDELALHLDVVADGERAEFGAGSDLAAHRVVAALDVEADLVRVERRDRAGENEPRAVARDRGV